MCVQKGVKTHCNPLEAAKSLPWQADELGFDLDCSSDQRVSWLSKGPSEPSFPKRKNFCLSITYSTSRNDFLADFM